MVLLWYDRYSEQPEYGIDCTLLTLNASSTLEETLDRWYRDAPIRRLLVIDGGSTDGTIEMLDEYPRVERLVKQGMTTGKAWELLKDMIESEWFIWVDVGKIPREGWYDEMKRHVSDGDILGSIRYNYKDGVLTEDPIISDPSQRLLGGPWMVRTSSVKSYHVDDDFAQRNIDIIIRKQLEEYGGRYHLVTSTSHICYLPTPVTDKKILQQRHDQNARGIIKYISPEYAKEHAKYLLNDHWMLMYSKLPSSWIHSINPSWNAIIRHWKIRRYLYAKTIRLAYNAVKSIHNRLQ